MQANRADRMKKNDLKAQVATVVRACQEKKAADISILRLDEQASGFTDYFVLCSGANPRQVQAIADEVDQQLSAIGVQPKHIEGYTQADWLLMDYVDFVVHIFSENARKFYDLERLWKSAKRLQPADLEKACAQIRCEEGPRQARHQAQACGQGERYAEAHFTDAAPQEVIADEASYRMDRPYPQLPHPVPYRRICEAAVALRCV